MPPSLRQIKNYLQIKKNVSSADLALITEENVSEKFTQFSSN